MRRRLTIAWISWLAMFIVGCQSQDELPELVENPIPKAVSDTAPTEVVPKATEVVPKATDEDPTPEQSKEPVAKVNIPFEPPFPGRADLFVAPKRDANVASRRDNSDSLGPVDLKGFVTPPGKESTYALLAIDGDVWPISEGQEKVGVKVISIEQPEVILQRGRARWTASLQ